VCAGQSERERERERERESARARQGERETECPSSLCVCTRVYKHTHTQHPNTRKNREIYQTKPLSLPLSKHSLPRQQQSLTMNKLEKSSLPFPPHPRMQVLRNTCDTHTCKREIGQYKQTKCAYTSAYVHPHARVYDCICIHIHRHTHIHIQGRSGTCKLAHRNCRLIGPVSSLRV